MAEILPFKRPAKGKPPGKVMCANNHHKWKIWQKKQFDVKAGKLVTVYRCERCGKQRVRAD